VRQEELIDSVIGDAILIIQVAPIWAIFLALFSALFAIRNWKGEAIDFAGTRMIAIYTCNLSKLLSE